MTNWTVLEVLTGIFAISPRMVFSSMKIPAQIETALRENASVSREQNHEFHLPWSEFRP